jgi:exodeoxyribonuclease V beta subunit
MQSLDTTTFPLTGVNLIEASAGTGKTYALVQLYLRYLVEAELAPARILVVTFTEAATQELRERIRQRIHALRQLFETGAGADPDLLQLLRHSDDPSLPEAARQHSLALARNRLRLAERQMDRAEIHTIHGFCQRLLQEFPLELAVPVQQQLLEDTRALIEQVIEDFWRREVLTLPLPALATVLAQWQDPAALRQTLLPMLERPPERLLPVAPAGIVDWATLLARQAQRQQALKTTVLDGWAEARERLADSNLKYLDRKLAWWQQIRTWCETDERSPDYPGTRENPNLFLRFLPDALDTDTRKDQQPPRHPVFDWLAQYFSAPDEPAPEDLFLATAYHCVERAFQAAKRQRQQMDFNDLIRHVERGLVRLGADSAFCDALRQRFGVALIDEFQDTDPAQYRIFRTLFAPDAGPQSASGRNRLVMIGDPKQAIYGFRGGDLATYLRARNDTRVCADGALYTMDRNWRSRPAMVEAVNVLFARHANPFLQSEIPFHRVRAARAEPEPVPEGGPVESALHIVQLASAGLNKDQINRALGLWCRREILDLLAHGGVDQHEIAILVRSSAEADYLKDLFADVGVALCFEGKQSIFESAEAQALSVLLDAVATPGNIRALRSCLADPLWALPDDLLLGLERSPAGLNHYLNAFATLNETWQRHGILRTVRQALQVLDVLGRWRDTLFGAELDRRLTNLNQLAELLQRQSGRHRGHHDLLRWLRRQIQAHLQGRLKASDATRLRLESDEQLIQVQTMHKSKGLEYRHVFIPFLFSTRKAEECWFHDAQGQRSLDLQRSPANMHQAEQDRLAEDMRLLYVALTRARDHCYLGTCAYASNHPRSAGLAHTAWGWLLFPQGIPARIDDALLQQTLQALVAEAGSCIEVRQLDPITSDLPEPAAGMVERSDLSTGEPLRMQRLLDLGWRRRTHSFTGLVNESQAQRRTETSLAESEFERVLSGPRRDDSAVHILDFPRGARAGTFLHTLFERFDFSTGQLAAPWHRRYASPAAMIETLLRQTHLVASHRLPAWTAYLTEWIPSVLARPLIPGLCLGDLAPTERLSELAFHFSVRWCDCASLNRLLANYLADFEPLSFEAFGGHLKGAIDLVFRHHGQYYILDYKSNHLGDAPESYAEEALRCCMREHHYALQYLLYGVALHRYLRARIGHNYEYERDVGGVIYLFLRALSSEHAPGQGAYCTRPPKALIDELDALLS